MKEMIKREDFTKEQMLEFGLTPEVIKQYNDYLETISQELDKNIFGECISPVIKVKK